MNSSWLKIVSCAALAWTLSACNDGEERFENIEKLRAFGATTLPIITEPSTDSAPRVVTITVYAAVPLGQNVTAEPYEDPAAVDTTQVPVTLVPGSEAYEEHATFRIYSVQATQPVPPATVFESPLGAPDFVRLRYGIRLASGDESENVVGYTLIYPAGNALLTRVAPTVEITKPASTDVSGTEELEATINDPDAEPMRVGWFASDGEVKNRRARITEWKTPGAGPATLIFTIRGRKTGAFAFKVMDVNVQ